jgi:hypothetical protein
MTTEEKELLIKDICARLPYGIKAHTDASDMYIETIEGISLDDGYVRMNHHNIVSSINIEHCKPYLRPMSSMTNREKGEYTSLRSKGGYDWDEYEANKLISWLDKNMFDHRGLIKKDLALPLTPEQ